MTLPLFANAGPEVILDEAGSFIEIRRAWHTAPALLSEMLASRLPRPEEYRTPGTASQVTRTLRLSCAFGPPGLRYRYAGQERVAHPWPESLLALLPRLREYVGQVNFALCNVYSDGRAQLGWHADKEWDLMPGAAIGSLSFGATRTFQIRRQGVERIEHSVRLEHGDLLVMRGQTQHWFEHRLVRQLGVKEPRVNFTFRSVRT